MRRRRSAARRAAGIYGDRGGLLARWAAGIHGDTAQERQGQEPPGKQAKETAPARSLLTCSFNTGLLVKGYLMLIRLGGLASGRAAGSRGTASANFSSVHLYLQVGQGTAAGRRWKG